MSVLPLSTADVDAAQQIDLTGTLSWYMSSPSELIAGSHVLMTIKGDAPPFTWAITGAAAADEKYSFDFTTSDRLWNMFRSDPNATATPIIEVRDARGNIITQEITVT